MSTFTINFTNNSSSSGNFCLFQQNHNSPNPSVFSTAWRVEAAAPNTRLAISWNTDFYFFWAKTGQLQPGVIFNAGENALTSLTERNRITVTKVDRDYKFTNQRDGYQHGSLTIEADATTVPNQASVGIGLSGAVAYAVQAQPNMTFMFVPRLEYWVAFGKFQQGQVLDPSGFSAMKIDFPPGIFSMNATLNPDNSWTITPGMD